MTQVDLSSKITVVKDPLLKFNTSNETIFVISTGGIVLPNNQITPWFVEVMNADELRDRIAIYLVSKFKPHPRELRHLPTFSAFQVYELSAPETQSLFVQYLKHLGVNINPKDTKLFLRHFHGIPEQIVYTANLISKTSVPEVNFSTI